MKIRQPIVTVAGHVDHGKTSLLDSIRRSSVAEEEAGNITQKISFTLFPADHLRVICPLIDKKGIKLEIPGFLFIDTPGHAAFNNLRKRGGSLADLALLVIDINEGIKPQTAEVIQILKFNKTPFIVALNKIDRIGGWSIISDDLQENIGLQPDHVKQEFDEKLYTLMGSLNSYGFNGEIFYKIKDFTKNLVLVPCSAKTKEGIPELLMLLCGLSQKFLKTKLGLGDKAKGVVLEIKKDRTMSYIEAILYDGILKVGDDIAIASFDKTIFSKVKSIQEIQPLSFKFSVKDEVVAASGIKIQVVDKVDILPGMPFMHYSNELEVKEAFKKEIEGNIKTDKKGIVIKADSLGSLEAMIILLKQANINIVKAGIGDINKSDILTAKANLEIDPVDAIVLGFNVDVDEEAKKTIPENVKIITDDVVYKLIEKVQEFRTEKLREIEKERLMSLSKICKIEILHKYVFRNTNPAIFGIRIVSGRVSNGIELIDEFGESVGRIKNIQSQNKSIEEATQGMEVAISVSGINFERKLSDKNYLYSDISEKQFKKFEANRDLLSSDEIKALQEIRAIKEKKKF
ncbi:MAG: translation initiation factor IF-2 [Candidatus Pacearchaeota archaeon]